MSSNLSNTVVERLTSAHPRWDELMSLQGVQDLDLEAKVQPWHLGIYTLAALRNSAIVGTLRFWTQVIGVDEDKPPYIVDGEPAIEAKVVTLHVLDEFRRQGVGRRLQIASAA